MARTGLVVVVVLAMGAGVATALGATWGSDTAPLAQVQVPQAGAGGATPAGGAPVRDGVTRYALRTTATGPVTLAAIVAGSGGEGLRFTTGTGTHTPAVEPGSRATVTFVAEPRSGAVVVDVDVRSTRTSDQLVSLAVVGAPFTMGVSTPGMPASAAALDAWEAATGVQPGLTATFTSFLYDLNPPALRALHARTGATPVITLEPWDPTRPTVDAFPLTEIVAGRFDGYLRRQAAAIQGLGIPVVVRFAHEMNGNWYPWSYGFGGRNLGTEYVDAWRHVHQVMNAGAPGAITWAWTPAAWDSSRQPDYASMYPGDEYVDWTGLSAYLDDEDASWATRIQPSINRLDAVAPAKPIVFAEAGVLPGPRRPAQLADLMAGARSTPRAIGLIYFDIVGRHDWRLDTDPASAAVLH